MGRNHTKSPTSNNTLKAIRSVAFVTLSNIATIVAGIIVGFLIPKIMSIEGYGYYKTFTLYVSYAGFFSLGIIDGIVLEYGGYDYNQINKKLFRGYFRWYILIHIVWICILTVIALLNYGSDYCYILLMMALYLAFSNLVGYFQQISQITQRFKEYSIAKTIQSVMKVCGGLLMLIVYYITKDLVDYRIYITLITFGFLLVTVGYIFIYKAIIFGDSESLMDTYPTIVHLAKIGFPLLFANLCSTLILNLDRLFVNILFTNAEYAIYAFAYNLLSLITVATSAISTVLYPLMKRTDENSLSNNYSDMISAMIVFVFGALIVFFPLSEFINWYLPQYVESLIIFRIIFPGLAISSAITVIMHNYYKTFGDNTIFFKKSLLILLLSGIANIIAYLAFRTTIAVSIASIITMVIWYIYTENYFVTRFGYSRIRNLMYMLLMMIAFYISTSISILHISGIVYVALYIILVLILERNSVSFIKKLLLER